MAYIFQPTHRNKTDWKQFVESRPPIVRDIARRFYPWELYRMKPSGKRVTICAFSDDRTITVNISGQFNFLMFSRLVFGVDPDDLEPCDMPSDDEIVGSMLPYIGKVEL